MEHETSPHHFCGCRSGGPLTNLIEIYDSMIPDFYFVVRIDDLLWAMTFFRTHLLSIHSAREFGQFPAASIEMYGSKYNLCGKGADDELGSPWPTDVLFKAMRAETKKTLDDLRATTYAARGTGRPVCIYCPSGRNFQKKDRLIKHLRSDHSGLRLVPFKCNKILRSAQAIYDNDQIRLLQPSSCKNYLARAVAIIKQQCGRCLPPQVSCKFDRAAVMILDSDGPRFVPRARLSVDLLVRKVTREVHYTKGFATLVFRLALTHRGTIEQVMTGCLALSQAAGNELTSLIPRNLEIWQTILEDVFSSPQVHGLKKGLVQECVDNKEYVSISADASRKPTYTLIGQDKYIVPECERGATDITARRTPSRNHVDMRVHGWFGRARGV